MFRNYFAIILLCPFPNLSHAGFIEASFSGTVVTNNSLVNNPPLGTVVTGAYTLNTGDVLGEGSNCNGVVFCWSGPDHYFEADGHRYQLGSLLTSDGTFSIDISNQDAAPGAGEDIHSVNLNGTGLFSSRNLIFTNSSGTTFESTANDLIPSLGNFDSAVFSNYPTCFGTGCLFREFYTANVTSWTFNLLGDFNDDSAINGVDFLAWQQGFGTLYGESDYNYWESNFGAASAAVVASSTIPEPTTLTLAALSLCLIATRRRR